MAYSLAQDTAIVSIEAGAALTQGQLVKLSSGTVVANTGSDIPFGVILDTVASGDEASVYVGMGEIVYLQAHDNAITQGQYLVAAAAGRVDGAGATGTFIGRALEASTAQGHLIKAVILTPTIVA